MKNKEPKKEVKMACGGKVKMAAGGSAKQRKDYPMTKKPMPPKKK